MINLGKQFTDNPVYRKTWPDIVDSPIFQSAIAAALLNLTLKNRNSPDMGTSAANAMKLEGAQQFVDILMTLSDPIKMPPTRPGAHNLNHQI